MTLDLVFWNTKSVEKEVAIEVNFICFYLALNIFHPKWWKSNWISALAIIVFLESLDKKEQNQNQMLENL